MAPPNPSPNRSPETLTLALIPSQARGEDGDAYAEGWYDEGLGPREDEEVTLTLPPNPTPYPLTLPPNPKP